MSAGHDTESDEPLRGVIVDFGSEAVRHVPAPTIDDFRPRQRGVLAIVAALGVVGLISLAMLVVVRQPASTTGAGLAASASCESMSSAVAIDCDTAQRSVSWGDARIDRTRIWLTTLEAVKETLNPPRQVLEPPPNTPVWVFVYDGRWTCCLVGSEDGLTEPTDHSRWLLVVDATSEDAAFIYVSDWSGRDVPESLPPMSVGG